MSLLEITDELWVNPDRVVSVEWRTVTNRDGETKSYTELTLDTHARWMLDMPFADVIKRLTEW